MTKIITSILGLVPGWVYAIAVAALSLGLVVSNAQLQSAKSDLLAEKLEHSKTKESYAQAARVAEATARQKERDLQLAADENRKAKDAEISALRRDVRNLRDRLSDLPVRPASDTGAPASFGKASAGCPGPVVYRDTAEALVDEAERADTVRIALQACYRAYDAARSATGSNQE